MKYREPLLVLITLAVVASIPAVFLFIRYKKSPTNKTEAVKEKPAFNIVSTQIMAKYHEDTGKFEYTKSDVTCEDVLRVKLYEVESLKAQLTKLTQPPTTPAIPPKKEEHGR